MFYNELGIISTQMCLFSDIQVKQHQPKGRVIDFLSVFTTCSLLVLVNAGFVLYLLNICAINGIGVSFRRIIFIKVSAIRCATFVCGK